MEGGFWILGFSMVFQVLKPYIDLKLVVYETITIEQLAKEPINRLQDPHDGSILYTVGSGYARQV